MKNDFEVTRTSVSAALRQRGSLTVLAAALCAIASPAAAQDSKEIVVTAQRVNATHVENGGSAGVLGNKAAEDLPFNVRSFDETLILNQQPKSLGEVLENDPTVRTTYGFGNAAESFVIRGFELFGDDVGLNGLYGITPRQLIAPELFESVQVLNGSSAFLNGAAPGGSGLGGSVNLLLKRAGDAPLNRVTAGYTSDSHFGGSFDVSRRFGDFGVRVNGNYQDGQLGIDREDRMSGVLGAGFDWSNGPVRVSLDLGYQKVRVDDLRPKVTIYTATIPRVPKASANYSQKYTYSKLRDIFGVFNFEYDFAENATLWAKAGARDGSEDGIYGGFNLFDATTGDGSGNALYVPRTDNNEAAEVGARVKLGSAVTHEIVVGGNASWQVNRNAFDFLYGDGFAGFPTNLYDTPQLDPLTSSLVGGDLNDPYPISRTRLWSAFASDTVGFLDDRILVTGGLRLQTLNIKTYGYYDGGLPESAYDADEVTPVVGVVVKPVEGLSLYANRIEALQQGPSAGFGAANFGEVFPPYVSTQYEFGGKGKIGPMFVSLAFYQIKKPNGYIDNNTLVFAVNGEQRNRGMELTLNGELAPGLRLISGLAVNDAKLTKTGDATEGNDAKGVPDWTANANIEWDTPMIEGLTLTGRVIYTGKQWVDAANTLRLPDWAVFNLGARYVLAAGDVPVTLRFNVDNVANKRYWASAYDAFSSALLQGQPRTFKASISADF
ncbi:TonB-dependent siderophore receptor [Novosphingobium sp. PP1Y]|uniref:TonB-dependent receptor n=1 Tax=Novosphingobium sp. PP1Y TaxID=702113 RepID=UPI00020EE8C1|nr:TonB-dependent receptor [Novosphingobium sp. PP1Y]CCA91615.1 putative TonB-dependent receptor protein [Novosphingobium sp. PP1Y]